MTSPSYIGRITTRKKVIEHFAFEIARLQRRADECYYLNNDQEHSSWLLDQVIGIKELACHMGICDAVYKRAYEIYDFRNSGKTGYTLKNGVIVREDQDGCD